MLLEVKNLFVTLNSEEGPIEIIKDFSFTLMEGETLGIVGESGSGKSIMALSLLKLIDKEIVYNISGEVIFDGLDIFKCKFDELMNVRRNGIGFIFQEPMSSFNPLFSVGNQLEEVLNIKEKNSKKNKKKTLELLELVDIKDPEIVLKKYPHQLSGGMLQRIMIAMALALEPKILIADEPTTALDVTIQFQILKLLKRIQKELNMSIIIISHDLGVIKELCKNVMVMYCGNIVERNSVNYILKHPLHPYTKGLIDSYISLETASIKDKIISIKGSFPHLDSLPKGCNFQDRCPRVDEECKGKNGDPILKKINDLGEAACFHPFA